MAATFNMLRANDLIWSFVVNNYLLGSDPFPFDLLYWNCDSTRMPAAMHSFYLRNMYIKNLLREPGGSRSAGVPIDLSKVDDAGLFHLGDRGPHRAVEDDLRGRAAPRAARCASCWRARATSPASSIRRRRRSTTTGPTTSCPPTPDAWFAGAKQHEGSWWPTGAQWITPYLGREVPARVPGKGKLKVIEAAPGTYARIRADAK